MLSENQFLVTSRHSRKRQSHTISSWRESISQHQWWLL